LAPQATVATSEPPPRFSNRDEAEDFALLQAALWPADIQRLAGDFLTRHPGSRLEGSAKVALEGAKDAAKILRRTDVQLFRSAFQPTDLAPASELAKASRGDKDAAARLARAHARDVRRYEGWLQYAQELGNGIASYELAVHYRGSGQPLLAAQFEARARELGYTPPPSLDNSRK
jgi:hypothetical protein